MNKDEALSILKEFHDKSALFSVRTALEVFFPEFKESEDERIRKFLIKMARNGHGGDKEWWDKCVAWLEKQGKVEIEKPITIGKCKLTGKAAELAKEVTPESLEEAKEKLNAEEKLNQRLNQEIQGWLENSEHMDYLWCTVKDEIELTARHFFELGLKVQKGE